MYSADAQSLFDTCATAYGADIGLVWKIRDSFIKYVARTADGRCSLSGGAKIEKSAGFFYPLKNEPISAPTGNTVELDFHGDVRFSAHRGMMFVRIGLPKLIVTGTRGQLWILADPADDTEFTLLAECDLELARDELQSLVGLAGRDVRLTEAGAEIFGLIYKPGDLLDDFSVSLRLTKT